MLNDSNSPRDVSPPDVSSPDNSGLSIAIEVDIDPPPRGPDDPSDEELEKLGLPTHHVHYKAKVRKI